MGHAISQKALKMGNFGTHIAVLRGTGGMRGGYGPKRQKSVKNKFSKNEPKSFGMLKSLIFSHFQLLFSQSPPFLGYVWCDCLPTPLDLLPLQTPNVRRLPCSMDEKLDQYIPSYVKERLTIDPMGNIAAEQRQATVVFVGMPAPDAEQNLASTQLDFHTISKTTEVWIARDGRSFVENTGR